MILQHFLLTRFNILLWRQDKEGKKVRTTKWLEHRFTLFEKYCLPSIKNQTCQDFEWIVLFDSMTPDSFKERIACYQEDCQQFVPVYVAPEDGWRFADYNECFGVCSYRSFAGGCLKEICLVAGSTDGMFSISMR